MTTNPGDLGGPFRYGGAAGRRSAIVRRVRHRGYVSLTDLSNELDVSARTVRRDLADLATDGLIAIVPGGAIAPGSHMQSDDLSSRAAQDAAAKRQIAAHARRLVQAGATAAFDAGTTVSFVADALADHGPLTAISHSLPVINRFAHSPEVSLIAIGGSFDQSRNAFLGPMTRESLQALRADFAFLACSGVHSSGFACASQADAEIKQILLSIASRKVLVATSAVFNRVAPIRLAEFGAIDTLITDEGLLDADRQRLEAAGVEVQVAQAARS